MTKIKLFTLLTACSLITLNAQAAEITTNTAKLQAMDKITGRVSEIIAPIDTEIKFGSLSIVTRACKTRPPEETPENFAFMDIIDIQANQDPVNIFKGWMLSSSPALNPMEHPVYDVWLLQCIDTQSSLVPLTAEQLAQRDKIAQHNIAQNVEEVMPEPIKEELSAKEETETTAENVQEDQEQTENLPEEKTQAAVLQTAAETSLPQDSNSNSENTDLQAPKMLINIPDQQITIEEQNSDDKAEINQEAAIQTIEQITQETNQNATVSEEQKTLETPEEAFAADNMETSLAEEISEEDALEDDTSSETIEIKQEESSAQPTDNSEVEIPEAIPQEEIIIPEGFEEESFNFNEENNSQE